MTQAQSESFNQSFIFAGGGTGGHIYPALAIIEELRSINPDVDVHILCSKRAIDSQILSETDIPFTPIDAMPISTKPKGFWKFVSSWGPSVRATRACIKAKRAQNKQVTLIAMGGYDAAPSARAARTDRCKVALVNLDAVPGKANVLSSRRADRIMTAAQINGFESWERVRPIVRPAVLKRAVSRDSSSQARAQFKLDPQTQTLLITGGSQGATSINEFMLALVQTHPEAFNNWQIIHQVGGLITEDSIEVIRTAYAQAGINAWVERFINDMGQAFAASDLSIGRCGAGTVAECWGAQIPSVFFPYPYHADEHQKHNAQVLVDAGAAIVLDDQIHADQNLSKHADQVSKVLQGHGLRDSMRAGYEQMPAPDGAAVIAQSLLGADSAQF